MLQKSLSHIENALLITQTLTYGIHSGALEIYLNKRITIPIFDFVLKQ